MRRSGSAEKLFNLQLQYNLTEHLTDAVVDDQVGSPVCRGFGFVYQHQFVAPVVADQPRRRVHH